jgi:hypothetical protein
MNPTGAIEDEPAALLAPMLKKTLFLGTGRAVASAERLKMNALPLRN